MVLWAENKAAIFFAILLFGSLYLPYSKFTIIIPNYIQIFVQNPENPSDETIPRYYPPPAVNFNLVKSEESSTTSPKIVNSVEAEIEKAETSETAVSEFLNGPFGSSETVVL
mgnify:CR=1 FL=1